MYFDQVYGGIYVNGNRVGITRTCIDARPRLGDDVKFDIHQTVSTVLRSFLATIIPPEVLVGEILHLPKQRT